MMPEQTNRFVLEQSVSLRIMPSNPPDSGSPPAGGAATLLGEHARKIAEFKSLDASQRQLRRFSLTAAKTSIVLPRWPNDGPTGPPNRPRAGVRRSARCQQGFSRRSRDPMDPGHGPSPPRTADPAARLD